MDTIQSLRSEIDKLKADLTALNSEFYLNNFSAHQDFNKYSNFSTQLKVPHYDVLPTIGEIGEIFEYGGKLYIFSALNTPTVVGTQT